MLRKSPRHIYVTAEPENFESSDSAAKPVNCGQCLIDRIVSSSRDDVDHYEHAQIIYQREKGRVHIRVNDKIPFTEPFSK